MNPSMADETVKLPIILLKLLGLLTSWKLPPSLHCPAVFYSFFCCVRFEKPDDGLPAITDWIQCAESMLFGGVELGREPLDCSTNPTSGGRGV